MRFQFIAMPTALIIALALLIPVNAAHAESNGKVKVFILAGQSNMVGYGQVKEGGLANQKAGTMESYLRANPDAYGHLVNDDGTHVVRDDVWVVNFTHKKPKGKAKVKTAGWLTTGFGLDEYHIGPEYGFGMVLGDHYDDPVLIIKCAWGGRSLSPHFLPPSAGDYPKPEKDGDIGYQYAETVRLVKDVLANLDKHFPDYDGNGYELVGFGWHQGWNDRVNQERVEAYAKNLEHFIKDMRKDLDAPERPFVIANTGMGGHSANPQATKLMEAQLSLADAKKYPAFEGNVGAVDTRPFQRPREQSPSKQGYHWFRNWETYFLIGDAMGKKMVQLLDNT